MLAQPDGVVLVLTMMIRRAVSTYVAKGHFGMMCNDKDYIRTANDFIGFVAQEANAAKCGAGPTRYPSDT